MQINSLQSASVIPQSARATNSKPTEPVSASAQVTPSVDQLDLSSEAQQLMAGEGVQFGSQGDIRTDRVAAIRQAIADGTYETPERMSAALDRVLDAFA